MARGREIFATTCAVCHGEQGTGGVGAAPPLDQSGHAWHHADPDIHLWVTEGKLGLGTRMPAYGDQLTADEISAVLAYVKTLWTPEQQALQAQVTRNVEESTVR